MKASETCKIARWYNFWFCFWRIFLQRYWITLRVGTGETRGAFLYWRFSEFFKVLNKLLHSLADLIYFPEFVVWMNKWLYVWHNWSTAAMIELKDLLKVFRIAQKHFVLNAQCSGFRLLFKPFEYYRSSKSYLNSVTALQRTNSVFITKISRPVLFSEAADVYLENLTKRVKVLCSKMQCFVNLQPVVIPCMY
jgi:hypothetical protein